MSNTLYHGTNVVSQKSIVDEGIRLNQNPHGGDFAIGFYLTPELECAKSIARRKAYGSGTPSIVELTLRNGFQKFVNVKDFGIITVASEDKKILEWAQFIVNNRCGSDYVSNVSLPKGMGDNNLDMRYDIVIGSIADGSVTKIARNCKSEKRLVTLVEAKSFLDKTFGLQYCICTADGLSMIKNQPRERKGVSWE